MELKTRAILVHNITGGDKLKNEAIETALNETLIVRNCANCTYSQWNDTKTSVYCERALTTPPLWAVAMGCTNFDFLPF